MKKILYFFAIVILMTSCFKKAGETDIIDSSEMTLFLEANDNFRKKINEEYRDPEESPLKEEDRAAFDSLPFFELDFEHRVKAKFERIKGGKAFQMPTTTERKPIYKVYALAHFTLRDTTYTLEIYQNQSPEFQKTYRNYLFLPFRDLTNGVESYGGGRFMDLRIPDGNTIILDFNQAYNPLCAYNDKYSCPIPPVANTLPTKIMAGVRYDADKYDH